MHYLEELVNTRVMHSENMAASISSKVLQIKKENIKRSLSNLDTVGHRQDYVTTIDEVMYFDDAKAESVNATWFTLESATKPVNWIACGGGNAEDYLELIPLVKEHVRTLICLNDKKHLLKKVFGNVVEELYEAKDMEEAVRCASIAAQENEIVLFSPSCKSKHAGETYIERGKQFIDSIKAIENERQQ